MTTPDRADIKTLDLTADEVAKLVGVGKEEVDRVDAIITLVQKVSETIARMRDRRHMTRAKLAELMSLSPGRISQLESGQIRHAPSVKTFAEIAHRLGYDVDLSLQDQRPEERAQSRLARWATSSKIERRKAYAKALRTKRAKAKKGLGALTVTEALAMNNRTLGESVRDYAAELARQSRTEREAPLFPVVGSLREEDVEETTLISHR